MKKSFKYIFRKQTKRNKYTRQSKNKTKNKVKGG